MIAAVAQNEHRFQGEDLIARGLSGLKTCFLAGTLGQGGAERQLFCILRALRQIGVAPRVFCLRQNEFWEERIKKLGVPITYVGQTPSKLMRLFRMVAGLRKDPPAVFQSQHFYTNAYVAATARILRLRDIGAIRSNGLNELEANGPISGWLNLHSPRIVTANSHAAIQYAVGQGVPAKRLYFLANVVDTEQFKPVVCGGQKAVRLVTVGSLIPIKRFDRFLRVLALLRRKVNRQVTGMIVGAGPLKTELEEQAEALGLLPDGVKFRGSVAEMAPVYRNADVCVLTSDYEGTPNVLLEAMASGLAVVATNVGGVSEVVRQGENGFLVEPGDETACVTR